MFIDHDSLKTKNLCVLVENTIVTIDTHTVHTINFKSLL
jgi:hypothetical protein